MYTGVSNRRTLDTSLLSSPRIQPSSTTTSIVIIHVDPSTSELLQPCLCVVWKCENCFVIGKVIACVYVWQCLYVLDSVSLEPTCGLNFVLLCTSVCDINSFLSAWASFVEIIAQVQWCSWEGQSMQLVAGSTERPHCGCTVGYTCLHMLWLLSFCWGKLCHLRFSCKEKNQMT